MNELEKSMDYLKVIIKPNYYLIVLHSFDNIYLKLIEEALIKFFHLSSDKAKEIMIKSQVEGRAVVGIFTIDVGETILFKLKKTKVGFNFSLELEK